MDKRRGYSGLAVRLRWISQLLFSNVDVEVMYFSNTETFKYTHLILFLPPYPYKIDNKNKYFLLLSLIYHVNAN